MTVAEIKDYIDIKIKYYSEIDQNLFTPIINVKREFEEVKRLLDELEPKAKWLYSADEDETPYYRCSNCGNISSDGTEDICENCGARMIDELKENDK